MSLCVRLTLFFSVFISFLVLQYSCTLCRDAFIEKIRELCTPQKKKQNANQRKIIACDAREENMVHINFFFNSLVHCSHFCSWMFCCRIFTNSGNIKKIKKNKRKCHKQTGAIRLTILCSQPYHTRYVVLAILFIKLKV